jgi:hypothetical protein
MAQMTGLGISTIWAMIKDGRLETRTIGRRRLVLVDSYRRYLASLPVAAAGSAKRNDINPSPGYGRGRGRPKAGERRPRKAEAAA